MVEGECWGFGVDLCTGSVVESAVLGGRRRSCKGVDGGCADGRGASRMQDRMSYREMRMSGISRCFFLPQDGHVRPPDGLAQANYRIRQETMVLNQLRELMFPY